MQTYLYSMNIRQLPPDAHMCVDLLPMQRAKKMLAFVRADDRLRCLAGWLLMARFLGNDLEARLKYGPYGKPFLPDGPCFSLSHSGEYAVLAVSCVTVGVDVELRRETEYLDLVNSAFHPAERVWFRKNPAPQAFYDVWTLKESYLKFLGTGLSVEPESFALDLNRYDALLRNNEEALLADSLEIHFRLYGDSLPGHSLAVCLQGDQAPTRVTLVSADYALLSRP